jgi:hypothetical protein
MAPGALIDDAEPLAAPQSLKEPRKQITNGRRSLTANGERKPIGRRHERLVDRSGFSKLLLGKKKEKASAPSSRPSSSAPSKSDVKSDAESSKESEEEKDQTMKCEIKHLDRRYDDKDETYFAERKNDVEKPKQKDWWRLFAFCLVRHYDEEGDLDTTKLYVNPQPLRQLLKDVIGNYPSDPIDVDDVKLSAPYHSLFHYRKQLEEEGTERFKDDAQSAEQLRMLLDWIRSHFETEIQAYEKCMSGDLKAIAYERLWTLFRPGTIIHSKVLQQNRAFRVRDTWYDEGEMPGMGVKVEFIDFDGERLGTRKTELFIPQYLGTRELSELSTMPLDMHDDAEEIKTELLERGRKFESYIGQHYLQYEGVALKKAEMGMGYVRFNVNGRVMIDCKTYHRLEPNDTFGVKELAGDETAKREKARRRGVGATEFVKEKKEFDKLSDENACLTNATVRGYSFTVKRFLEFFADQLEPIDWNTSCFDNLVLDAETKKTVRALVSMHAQKRDTLDDIVKGKGQGLVCVLHGPPGVGKTLTAECVAEYVQRPLYMVSSGDCESPFYPSHCTTAY